MSENAAKKKPKKSLTREERASRIARKARRQLDLAKRGIEDGDDDVAATFLFQAFENAVRAAAKSTGEFADTNKHWDLSAQAEDLAKEGYLKTDASDHLDELNSDRKEAAYGYEYEEEFEHSDFESAVENLESYLEEVESLIERGGKKLREPDAKP